MPNTSDDDENPDSFAPASPDEAHAGGLSAIKGHWSDGESSLPRAYEDQLSATERGEHGRFYTPRSIAETVVGWTLPQKTDLPRVLDPAVGCGVFLTAAFETLDATSPAADAEEILNRLVGIDVDATSLSIAANELSRRAGRDGGQFHHASFFDHDPATLGRFDAIIGNPPFVRAEHLTPDVEHYRQHLQGFDTNYHDGENQLSRRSDAYVYFVTHATRFLDDGGRLGLVLPTKWLTSDYGEDFQQFLYDHYAVRGIIRLVGTPFEDALVDPLLLLAERRERAAVRESSKVRVAHLKVPPESEAVRKIVKGSAQQKSAKGSLTGTEGVAQSDLRETRDVARRLKAPPALLELFERPLFVRLDELARIGRGIMTGANDFFFLDAEEASQWGIDDQFLRPALKSIAGFTGRALHPPDVERSLLDVHEYVTDVKAAAGGDMNLEAEVTAALAGDGHDALLAYIEEGEHHDRHAGRTCRNRRVWFDLGELAVPDAFVPKLLRERVFVVDNRAEAAAGNAIDCLHVNDDVDSAVLIAVLNASITKAAFEIQGRNEAGMLQLMTYETSSLPVPDPRAFDAEACDRIRNAFSELVAGREGAQLELDGAVTEALPALPVGPAEIRQLRDQMLRRRVNRRR